MEDLLCGRLEKRFLRDEDGRIILYVNPVCFQEVVDYLNGRKIAPTDSTPGKPHVGKENTICFQQLLLVFGLGYDRFVYSKKYVRKSKVIENKAEKDAHSRASQDRWKIVKFKTPPREKLMTFRQFWEKKKMPFFAPMMNLIIHSTC